MADNVLDVKKLLKGTKLTAKQIECVAVIFANNNITTIEQVDNLPQMGHLCFCDVYQLVAMIRDRYFNPLPEVKPVKKSEESKE